MTDHDDYRIELVAYVHATSRQEAEKKAMAMLQAIKNTEEHTAAWVDRVQNMTNMAQLTKKALATAALALALIPLTTHAMPAYPDTLTPPPVGCVVTHWTPDDYSAMAVCAGGYLVTKQDGTHGAWDDIPYAIGTTRVGPDKNGAYWNWPIWD